MTPQMSSQPQSPSELFLITDELNRQLKMYDEICSQVGAVAARMIEYEPVPCAPDKGIAASYSNGHVGDLRRIIDILSLTNSTLQRHADKLSGII